MTAGALRSAGARSQLWPRPALEAARRLIGDASTFRSGVASTLATQIFLFAAATLQGALVARWLGPVGKGQLALVVLVLTVSQLLLNPGLDASYVYFTGARRAQLPDLTRQAVAVCLLVFPLGIGAVWLLVATGLMHRMLPGVPGGVTILAVGLLPVTLFMALLGSILRGQQRFHALNRILVIDGVVTVAVGVTLLIPAHAGVQSIIIGNAVGDGVAALLAVRMLRGEGAQFRPAIRPEQFRAVLSYGARAQGGNLVQFFNYRLDQFLLNLLATTAAVGTYSVSVALAEAVWLLPNAVSNVLFARAANASPAVMDRLTPRVARWTLGLSLAACAALALGGDALIRLIYSSSFGGAYTPLLWLLPGTALFAVANVVAHDLAGRGHPGYNSLIAGVALGVTVILNVVLIPGLGASGAAIASSASYGLTALLTVLAFMRIKRKGQRATERLPLRGGLRRSADTDA
jgi:O-antigen/teichoic acid export membrane protein